MKPKSANLTIRKWGNSLAVRIPAAVAHAARLEDGQAVEVSADGGELRVTPVRPSRPTLQQRLAAFDPPLHGGEAMSVAPVGRERWE